MIAAFPEEGFENKSFDPPNVFLKATGTVLL